MSESHELIFSGYCYSRGTIGCLLLKATYFVNGVKRDFMKKTLVSCAITLNVCELSLTTHLATCEDGLCDG